MVNKKFYIFVLSFVFAFLSCFCFFTFNSQSVYAEDDVITDLTGYQWVGNDNMTFTGFYDTSANFTIDGFTAVFGNYLSDDGSIFKYYTINKISYFRSNKTLQVLTYNTAYVSQANLAIYDVGTWDTDTGSFKTDSQSNYNFRVITCFLSGSRLTDSNFISFLQTNGTLTYVGSERVIESVVDNYELGFNDGVNYATNMLSGFGPFLYANWSIVDRFDYSKILSDLTGRFTNQDFNTYTGGFTISDSLFVTIEDYFLNNPDKEGVFKIDFDNYLPISQYNSFITYNFTFGNEIYFILDSGITVYFDNDSISKSISLVDYSSNSIVSIIITFASSFSDYGNFGLSSNSNFMVSYNNGFNDGFISGSSDGYSRGVDAGKSIGYQEGYRDAGDYTFFSLISAVVDAPINAFKSLLNFNILGINILGFLTGLLTLALCLVVVKFILGGK